MTRVDNDRTRVRKRTLYYSLTVVSTQPKLTWLATNVYIREVPRLFTLQHFKNGAWNQNISSHCDKEVLPPQNKFSETSSTTKSPFLWEYIKEPRASDFRINTVIQIENYLKNNSLLHSPMSAADRVQLDQILGLREGCGKSKWKFKMAFAMKGGGSRGGLVCH